MVVVGLAAWSIYAARKRREELSRLAKSRGLHFDPGRNYGYDAEFPGFSCLQRGSRRYAYNILSGEWDDRQFLGFDYHYATHSTDSKGRRKTHHHHFSAVILGSDVPLEPLFLRPEGFFDKLKEFVGFDDIDFESTEFSKAFYVKAADRKWAFDVIHQRTMEFLLASPRFHMEFGERWVIAHDRSRFSVEEFSRATDVIRGVLDRLPDYIKKQQRGD